MKAVLLGTDRKRKLTTVAPTERPDASWAVVRVRAAGLCGSDIQKFLDDPGRPYIGASILGHEIAGDLCEPDPTFGTSRVAVMPLISCGICDHCSMALPQLCRHQVSLGKQVPGGFADCVAVPIANVYPIGESVSYEAAACTDILAVALHCYRLSDAPVDRRVLIIGDGPLALSCVQVYGRQNHVTLLGIHKGALDVARSFNAAVTTSANDVPREHYHCVIEAVGRRQESTLAVAIESVFAGGTVVGAGVFSEGYLARLPVRTLFYKEAVLRGANSYQRSDFAEAAALLKTNDIDFSAIITHVVPLDEFEHGLSLATTRSTSGAIKVVFRP